MNDESTLNLPRNYPFYLFAIAIAAPIVSYLLNRFMQIEVSDISSFVVYVMVFGSIFLLAFSFLRIEMAVIAFVFVFPIARFELPTITFYFTFGDAFINVLGIAWLTRIILQGRNKLFPTFLDRPVFFFFFFSLISLMRTVRVGVGLKEIVQNFEYLALTVYLFSVLISDKEMLDNLFQSLALSSLLMAAAGILEYIQAGGGGYRVHSMFGHFNAFGCYMGMMVPLVFNLILIEKNNRMRLVYLVALGLDVISLLLTFSRGSWIAALVGVIVSGQIRGMGQLIKIVTLTIFLAIIGSMFVPQRFIGRASSITKVDDSAALSRLRQYRIAWAAIQDYPLTGVGIDNTADYAIQKDNCPACGEIHNLFLHMAMERGLTTAAALLWIFVAFFYQIVICVRKSESPYFQSLYVGIGAAVASYLIANMTAFMLVRGVGIFFGLLLGLFIAVTRIEAAAKEREDEFFFSSEISRTPRMYVGS